MENGVIKFWSPHGVKEFFMGERITEKSYKGCDP